jgi:hypothetical protein
MSRVDFGITNGIAVRDLFASRHATGQYIGVDGGATCA